MTDPTHEPCYAPWPHVAHGGCPGVPRDQGERRTAQIAAVRDVMGWGQQPDAWNEEQVANCAAELVDAVMALAGPPGPTAAAGPIEPDQVGYLVTGDRCGRCGDINYDEQRVCLTCTHPDHPCSRAYLEATAPAQPEPTWRVGRHNPDLVYHQTGPQPSDHDPLKVIAVNGMSGKVVADALNRGETP